MNYEIKGCELILSNKQLKIRLYKVMNLHG